MIAVGQRKVLVLNKWRHPIAVVPLERAICLLVGTYCDGNKKLRPKATVLDGTPSFREYTWEDWSALKAGDGEAVIRGVKQDFRVPEIILLSRYNRYPQQRIHFSRRTIYRRDAHSCQYCGCKPGTSELSIDHVVPRSRGGKTTWENCVIACTNCNRKKADRTPEECGMKLLRKPYKPKFTLYRGDFRCKSWEDFLGVSFWECTLENDMGE